MGNLAAFIGSSDTIEQTVDYAKLVEAGGYHSTWLVQIADREATIVAAAIAGATSRIQIGTGVLPMYPRTPVVMAQTAATLDELSGGRFILGLGTSHKITIEIWHGMELSKPLSHMREYVSAVRAIMNGQPFFGENYKTAFSFGRFEPYRRDMPIYVSCLSPKMSRLAGEVADGAVLWMCAPDYIAGTIVPAIREGRESVGKTMEGFEIVAAVPVAITENPAEARNAFRKFAVTYWSLPFYRAAIEGAGLGKELEAFDAGGLEAIPDHAVDMFMGAGDEAACRSILARYSAAGVTLPAVSVLPKHDGFVGAEATYEALAPGA